MPLAPPILTPIIAANLIATANIGPGVPQYSQGVANGVAIHLLQNTKVVTVDAGALGVGTSVMPLLIPPPVLLAAILAGFAAGGIIGPMSPLLALGLANGLSQGLQLAIVQTNHPTVGVGAGVARFVGSSAVPSIIQGFAAAGMTGQGPVKKATALGIGLDILFASFALPIPIVGAPAPSPGGGAGFGFVI